MKKIVSFGEVLWDRLPTGAVEGGASMNIAIRLSRHDNDINIISRVGNDKRGDKIKKYIQKENINIETIQVDNELPTSTVEIKTDKLGNALYKIVEPVAWDNMEFTDRDKKLLESTDIIIYGTLIARGETTFKTLQKVLKYGKTKIYDVNLRPPHYTQKTVELLMNKATFIKMNDDEIKEICQWYTPFKDYATAIKFIANRFSVKQICVTMGANGAIFWTNKKLYTHKGYKANVEDTIGAGDSFLATLLSELLQDKTPEQALDKASIIGSIVAEHKGANPNITDEMVTNKMKDLN